MKKILIFILAGMVLLVGCGKKEETPKEETSAAKTSAEESSAEESSIEESPAAESSAEESSANAASETDVELLLNEDGVLDLTELSSTMVYAEVYNMLIYPEEYIGIPIRMHGTYYSSYSEETGELFTACIIPDAAGCCQQGLQFQLAEERVYPDEYPEEGSPVTVLGEFQLVNMDNFQYAVITNAVLE